MDTHRKVLFVDAGTAFYRIERFPVGRPFFGPVDLGLHLAGRFNSLNIGAGLFAGSIIPGPNRRCTAFRPECAQRSLSLIRRSPSPARARLATVATDRAAAIVDGQHRARDLLILELILEVRIAVAPDNTVRQHRGAHSRANEATTCCTRIAHNRAIHQDRVT